MSSHKNNRLWGQRFLFQKKANNEVGIGKLKNTYVSLAVPASSGVMKKGDFLKTSLQNRLFRLFSTSQSRDRIQDQMPWVRYKGLQGLTGHYWLMKWRPLQELKIQGRPKKSTSQLYWTNTWDILSDRHRAIIDMQILDTAVICKVTSVPHEIKITCELCAISVHWLLQQLHHLNQWPASPVISVKESYCIHYIHSPMARSIKHPLLYNILQIG